MASHHRREAVRADLLRLCQSSVEPLAFYAEATRLVARAVPFEMSCWHQLDPATLLPTSHYNEYGIAAPAMWAVLEYMTDDILKFSDLAHARIPAAALSALTAGHLDRSMRYRDLLTARGFRDEARVAFVEDETCWGAALFLREPDHGDFEPEEVDFLADLSHPIAEAIRRSLLSHAMPAALNEDAPGLVVVDGRGQVESMTEPARRWIAQLLEVGSDEAGAVPASIASVAAAARVDPLAAPRSLARSRALTRGGRWLVLHGALLDGVASGRVAVIIEPARTPEIAPLIVAAYGLTAREREVCELVLQGLPTSVIASRLSVSPYTVQDHLKAIFEKTGARSRREIAGRFFTEHFQAPLVASGGLAAN